jgi:hypothetical protein
MYWQEHLIARNLRLDPGACEKIRLHAGTSRTAIGDGERVVREAEEFGLLCLIETGNMSSQHPKT